MASGTESETLLGAPSVGGGGLWILTASPRTKDSAVIAFCGETFPTEAPTGVTANGGDSNATLPRFALGACVGQPKVASSLLQRATQEPGMDDQQLVGVLYLLGRTAEMSNHGGDAVRYYERVLAVDITFSDVAERIGALEQVTR